MHSIPSAIPAPDASSIAPAAPKTAPNGAVDWARHWHSVEDWWTLAGVDTPVDAVPFGWLSPEHNQSRAASRTGSMPRGHAEAASRPARARTGETGTAEPGGRRDGTAPLLPPLVADGPLPADLDGFLGWWMSAAAPPQGAPVGGRVPPSGQRDAELFILTDMPEGDDRDHGALLSGELSSMFERMLKALGTERSRVWTASLIAARPGHGRIAPADLPRLGEIARHHIALVRPKRLWLMGQSASRALLGIDAPNNDRHSLHLNHDTASLLTVTTAHPRLLAAHPQEKKAAWGAMQALIAAD